MKANKINVPRGTYPIDFTVSGDSVYMLTFRYKSDTQTVEHGVWKSADGANFTEIFTVDYQQTMISLEYHKGYFYFGVACKNAMPLIKPLQSGTSDMAGAVYRLWAPQEPVQVVASTGSVTVTEGGEAMSVSFSPLFVFFIILTSPENSSSVLAASPAGSFKPRIRIS